MNPSGGCLATGPHPGSLAPATRCLPPVQLTIHRLLVILRVFKPANILLDADFKPVRALKGKRRGGRRSYRKFASLRFRPLGAWSALPELDFSQLSPASPLLLLSGGQRSDVQARGPINVLWDYSGDGAGNGVEAVSRFPHRPWVRGGRLAALLGNMVYEQKKTKA